MMSYWTRGWITEQAHQASKAPEPKPLHDVAVPNFYYLFLPSQRAWLFMSITCCWDTLELTDLSVPQANHSQEIYIKRAITFTTSTNHSYSLLLHVADLLIKSADTQGHHKQSLINSIPIYEVSVDKYAFHSAQTLLKYDIERISLCLSFDFIWVLEKNDTIFGTGGSRGARLVYSSAHRNLMFSLMRIIYPCAQCKLPELETLNPSLKALIQQTPAGWGNHLLQTRWAGAERARLQPRTGPILIVQRGIALVSIKALSVRVCVYVSDYYFENQALCEVEIQQVYCSGPTCAVSSVKLFGWPLFEE